MSVIHLQLDGQWAVCAEREMCDLPYHVPDLTLEAASQLPSQVLYDLLEIVDPPTRIAGTGAKSWLDEHGELHRDFDLPAAIWEDGSRFWFHHGKQHREFNRPAEVRPNGSRMWYHYGEVTMASYWANFVDPQLDPVGAAEINPEGQFVFQILLARLGKTGFTVGGPCRV